VWQAFGESREKRTYKKEGTPKNETGLPLEKKKKVRATLEEAIPLEKNFPKGEKRLWGGKDKKVTQQLVMPANIRIELHIRNHFDS